MKKSFTVDSTFNDMRIDRWIRNNLGNYPQGLIEKSLKSGKVKINNKKVKSSHKVITGDIVDLFTLILKKQLFKKQLNLYHLKKSLKRTKI